MRQIFGNKAKGVGHLVAPCIKGGVRDDKKLVSGRNCG
jgi:hypothetical protein